LDETKRAAVIAVNRKDGLFKVTKFMLKDLNEHNCDVHLPRCLTKALEVKKRQAYASVVLHGKVGCVFKLVEGQMFLRKVLFYFNSCDSREVMVHKRTYAQECFRKLGFTIIELTVE
jgi:UDP-galactopyranose mutase